MLIVTPLTKADHFLRGNAVAAQEHNKKDDFRTPPYLLRFIEEKFGEIEYDAACEDGLNNVAPALRLEDPWPEGTLIYSNPPYDMESITAWFNKGQEHAKTGGVHIMCLPEKVTQTFFTPFIAQFDEIIFLGGRINFISPYSVKGGTSMNGTIITRQGGESVASKPLVSGVLIRDLKAKYS